MLRHHVPHFCQFLETMPVKELIAAVCLGIREDEMKTNNFTEQKSPARINKYMLWRFFKDLNKKNSLKYE